MACPFRVVVTAFIIVLTLVAFGLTLYDSNGWLYKLTLEWLRNSVTMLPFPLSWRLKLLEIIPVPDDTEQEKTEPTMGASPVYKAVKYTVYSLVIMLHVELLLYWLTDTCAIAAASRFFKQSLIT